MINAPLRHAPHLSQVAGKSDRIKLFLLLGPALALIVILYLGGVVLAFIQSLGYLPEAGLTRLSLDAYRTLFQRPDFYRGLLLSFWVSLAATLLSMLLALAGTMLLRNILSGIPRVQRWVTFIYQLNLAIPHAVGALGILLLFSQSGWLARLAFSLGQIQAPADFPALVFDQWGLGIILEYTWKGSVFIGVTLLATMLSVGSDYEASARTLGATAWQRFCHVTLPLLRPALVSTSVLLFAFIFGGYEVPYMLGQRSPSMLPVMAYREYIQMDLASRPNAMGICVFIVVVVSALSWVYLRQGER